MKLIKQYAPLVLALLVILFVFVPVVSFAQDNCEEGKICNPIKAKTITEFLEVVLKGVIRIGLPIITLAIIYSGFLFVKARGNPEELTKAKDALLYTLIGAAVLMGAWALAELIDKTVKAL